jgi:hypothetical protein
MNRSFRIRIWLTHVQTMDTVIVAQNWFQAQMLGMAQSPVKKAVFMGEC